MDGEVVPLMMSTRRRADDAIRTLSVDTQMYVVVYVKSFRGKRFCTLLSVNYKMYKFN